MRNRRIRTIYNNVHNFYCKPPFYSECFIFTGWTTPFTSVSRKFWYRRVGVNAFWLFSAQNFGPSKVSGNIEFRNQLWTFIWFIWDFIWLWSFGLKTTTHCDIEFILFRYFMYCFGFILFHNVFGILFRLTWLRHRPIRNVTAWENLTQCTVILNIEKISYCLVRDSFSCWNSCWQYSQIVKCYLSYDVCNCDLMA